LFDVTGIPTSAAVLRLGLEVEALTIAGDHPARPGARIRIAIIVSDCAAVFGAQVAVVVPVAIAVVHD
jgi:hypothetical protein